MARGTVKSWPATPHDAVLLAGRPVGKIPTAELQTMLVDYGVPGAAHENGRAVNIEAYAAHLAEITAIGGADGVRRWAMETKARVAPRSIVFVNVRDETIIVGGWPKQALIDVANPPACMVVNDNVITARVANGFASYRRRKHISDSTWLCSVGESEFIPRKE